MYPPHVPVAKRQQLISHTGPLLPLFVTVWTARLHLSRQRGDAEGVEVALVWISLPSHHQWRLCHSHQRQRAPQHDFQSGTMPPGTVGDDAPPPLSAVTTHMPPLTVLGHCHPSPRPWAALGAEVGKQFHNPVALLFLGYRGRLSTPISPNHVSTGEARHFRAYTMKSSHAPSSTLFAHMGAERRAPKS